MRSRLESLAVEMAAPRLTERDIATLESMTNRLQTLASKKRYIEYLTLNFDFHLFFAKVTGRKELFDAIAALRKRIFRFYHAHIMLAHDPERYVQFHREIVDALK